MVVGASRFSYLRHALRRLLSPHLCCKPGAAAHGNLNCCNPVCKRWRGAKTRSATSIGGHEGSAPLLFSGLVLPIRGRPPCTLIPQAHGPCHTHTAGSWHCLLSCLPPRDIRGHPRGQACRASWIFSRQREYFCRICRRCSSSSRCRIRRKLCSSGMVKAFHCKGVEGGTQDAAGMAKQADRHLPCPHQENQDIMVTRTGLSAVKLFVE